jgi:beta-phosphoglucomutase-like phosphatase (HAD superfamily)
VVIFDCNGVLVDSEPIASEVLAAALNRVDVPLTPEMVACEFHGGGQRTFSPPSKRR